VIDGQAERGKAELVAAVERAYAEWESLVARVGTRLEEPYAGTWSLRDVSAHVCAYERFILEPLGGETRPLPALPPESNANVQLRNELLHAADVGRPTAEVMAEAAAVRRGILTRLRARSEEELRQPLHAWSPWPTWRWVVHLSVEHYDEHFPDLRRFAGA
jgi:uncharacterized damage-inducible protein DinB